MSSYYYASTSAEILDAIFYMSNELNRKNEPGLFEEFTDELIGEH